MKLVYIGIGILIILIGIYVIFAQFHSWSQSYSQRVQGVSADEVWRVWSDVNNWNDWQTDIEYAKLDGKFISGSRFLLKPKGSQEVPITLIKVIKNKVFIDKTQFPGATMFGTHEFIQHKDALEIKTTIRVEGFLGFLWRKIVAEGVANGMKEQTNNLVNRVKNGI